MIAAMFRSPLIRPGGHLLPQVRRRRTTALTVGEIPHNPRICRGFTLLELLIAIGLTSILMVALFAAMDIYFKLQVDSHEEITRQQISRTLLRQMTRDIQSVVFAKKKTVDEDSTKSSSSATSSSGPTSGSSGSSGSGSAGTTAGTTGGTSGGSSSGTGSSSGSSTTSSSGASSTTGAMLTYTSGLVGTTSDLLLYVNRPDRTLSYVDAQTLTSTSERTGDLMIIRYLIADTGAGGLSADIAKRFAEGTDGPVGLVRITGDLYGMSNAVQEGDDEDFTMVDKIDAKEVSRLEFRYYDGLTWQEEWDSNSQNALPVAIEILLTLRNLESGSVALSGNDPNPYALGETTNRMVVALPLAEPFIGETGL